MKHKSHDYLWQRLQRMIYIQEVKHKSHDYLWQRLQRMIYIQEVKHKSHDYLWQRLQRMIYIQEGYTVNTWTSHFITLASVFMSSYRT